MKSLCLLFALVLLQFGSRGQTVRFTDPTNEWFVLLADLSNGNPAQLTIYPFAWGGDSTVAGNTYKKLMGIQTILFREDTIARKIWCRSYFHPSEQLVYDHNWQIGDSIYISHNSPYFSGSITGVDSVKIGNTWHRKFEARTTFPFAIVEGLGNTFGPIFAAYPYLFERYWAVQCFFNNHSKPVVAPALSIAGTIFDNQRECTVSIESREKRKTATRLYPNPASNSVMIHNEQFQQQATITLTDVTGRTLINTEVKIENPYELSLNYPTGLYLLNLKMGNQIETFKLTIQN